MSGRGAAPNLEPVQYLAWMDSAACQGAPAEFFYAEDAGAQYREAKTFCRACPVVAECLDYGMRDQWGVYGGMTARERMKLRRSRSGEGLCVTCGKRYLQLGKHRLWAHGVVREAS